MPTFHRRRILVCSLFVLLCQGPAFTSKRGGDDVAQVYVIAAAGGEARRVSKMPMAPSHLKWSGDSGTVYGIAWTWPDTPDDASHRMKEKAQKESKSKALVIDNAV